MESIVATLVVGAVISGIVELVKKKWDINAQLTVALLSLVVGAVYYVLLKLDPKFVEEAIQVVLGSLAAATTIYHYLIKLIKK